MKAQSEPVEHDKSRVLKPWVRRRRILLLTAISVIGGLFVTLVAYKYFSDRNFEAQLQSLRAEGIPVTTEELQKWQASSASDESVRTDINSQDTALTAVDLYLEVSDILDNLNESESKHVIAHILVQFEENGFLSNEEQEKLNAYLAKHESALELLHKAALLPPGRFPLDYSKAIEKVLSSFFKIEGARYLLRGEAISALLENDPERVYNAIISGMALVKPLQFEPLVLSQRGQINCYTGLLGTLNDALACTTFNDTQLNNLQRMFEEAVINPSVFVNTLIAERIRYSSLYDDPSVLFKNLDIWTDRYVPGSSKKIIQTANAFGWFAKDREKLFDYVDRLIDAARLPYPESNLSITGIKNEVINSTDMTGIYVGCVVMACQFHRKITISNAYTIQGATAAAIERYRLDHSVPPDNLEVLVPDYFDSLPKDPFDLQPLRYRRDGNGYIIYSIGSNSVVDGGVQEETANEYDIMFQVRR